MAKTEKDAAKRSTASVCYEVRRPASPAKRLLRLDTLQIADSARLGTLIVRGDTLRGATGGLLAVRTVCPEP